MKNLQSLKTYREDNSGFTIVELMIALSVLAVLLVTTTTILIQIGALYSKGVNAADLQNATRNVVADISGQLQFSGKVPLGCTSTATTCYANTNDYLNTTDNTTETVYTYCISNTRYSYVLNRELGTDSNTNPQQITAHVLWRDTLTTDASTCPVPDIVNGTHLNDSPSKGDGYEMLGNHMRLTRFKIEQTPPGSGSGIYNTDVWTAFGDSDLVQTDPATGSSTCKGGAGTQFCSTSAISTQLTGRIY
jgi:prepilin-type N-terminal cleavage/methylation domain-containing protein